MPVWAMIFAPRASTLRCTGDAGLEALAILFLAGTFPAVAALLVNFVDDLGLEGMGIPLKYHPPRLLHKACILWCILAVAALALPPSVTAVDSGHKALAIQLEAPRLFAVAVFALGRVSIFVPNHPLLFGRHTAIPVRCHWSRRAGPAASRGYAPRGRGRGCLVLFKGPGKTIHERYR